MCGPSLARVTTRPYRSSSMPPKAKQPPRSRVLGAVPAAYKRYLKMALALPGAAEATAYGTPSVKVKGQIFSRLRTEAEGGLALRCDFLDREILLQAHP